MLLPISIKDLEFIKSTFFKCSCHEEKCRISSQIRHLSFSTKLLVLMKTPYYTEKEKSLIYHNYYSLIVKFGEIYKTHGVCFKCGMYKLPFNNNLKQYNDVEEGSIWLCWNCHNNFVIESIYLNILYNNFKACFYYENKNKNLQSIPLYKSHYFIKHNLLTPQLNN